MFVDEHVLCDCFGMKHVCDCDGAFVCSTTSDNRDMFALVVSRAFSQHCSCLRLFAFLFSVPGDL